jgi:hypothetical protein
VLTSLEVAARVLALGVFGRLFGPLVLVPGLFTLMAVVYGLTDGEWRQRIGLIGAVLGFLTTVALDVSGVLPTSYRFDELGMTVVAHAVELRPAPSLLLLVLTSLVLIVGPFLAMRRLQRRAAQAERLVRLQAWQLRQLAPEDVAPASIRA